jgi:hypothetical protein
MGQQRDFYVVHGTVVGIVTSVFNDFLPSSLGKVDFSLYTTNHFEVFLRDITDCKTKFRCNEVRLLDAGGETDRV